MAFLLMSMIGMLALLLQA